MKRKDIIIPMIAVFLVMYSVMITKKYFLLRDAYKKSEELKVRFCKENDEFRSKIDTLEKENFVLIMDNSRYQDFIQAQGY